MTTAMTVGAETSTNGNGNGFVNGSAEAVPMTVPTSNTTDFAQRIAELRKKMNATPTKVLVFCDGGCGGNMGFGLMARTSPSLHPHLHFAFADADAANLLRRLDKIAGIVAEDEQSNFKGWLSSQNDADGFARCSFIQLGPTVTKGQGAGADPELGYQAAQEQATSEELLKLIDGADLVFILSGLGGGSGAGSTRYIAEQCKERGKTALTISVKPFAREGDRVSVATAQEELLRGIGPQMLIYNQQLFDHVPAEKIKVMDYAAAFKEVDELSINPTLDLLVLLLGSAGLINVDFKDFQKLLEQGNDVYSGFAAFPNTGDDAEAIVDQVFTELVGNPFQDKQFAKAARGYILLLAGNAWKIDHSRGLQERLDRFFGKRRKDAASIRPWVGIFDDAPENVAFLITAAPSRTAVTAAGRRLSTKKQPAPVIQQVPSPSSVPAVLPVGSLSLVDEAPPVSAEATADASVAETTPEADQEQLAPIPMPVPVVDDGYVEKTIDLADGSKRSLRLTKEHWNEYHMYRDTNVSGDPLMLRDYREGFARLKQAMKTDYDVDVATPPLLVVPEAAPQPVPEKKGLFGFSFRRT